MARPILSVMIVIDRSADRPLYKQLADLLREQINSGALAPGQDLPAQTALAAEYDLGRDAVQDALGVLRTEGLIVTERGRPAYVREREVQVVTIGPGDQVEVRGAEVVVTRATGTAERYPAVQVVIRTV